MCQTVVGGTHACAAVCISSIAVSAALVCTSVIKAPTYMQGAGRSYSVASGESVIRRQLTRKQHCADLDGMRGGGPPDRLPPALHDSHLLAPHQKAPCLQLLDCSAP